MDVKCNNICIRVLVNRSGLMGEPMAGRRFKGDILAARSSKLRLTNIIKYDIMNGVRNAILLKTKGLRHI